MACLQGRIIIIILGPSGVEIPSVARYFQDSVISWGMNIVQLKNEKGHLDKACEQYFSRNYCVSSVPLDYYSLSLEAHIVAVNCVSVFLYVFLQLPQSY